MTEAAVRALDAVRPIVEAALAEAEQSRTDWDLRIPGQNKAARSWAFALRSTRARIEEARKQDKGWALAEGRRIDAEAADQTARIDAVVSPVSAAIESHERAEAERIGAIRTVLDDIKASAVPPADASPSVLRDIRARVAGYNGPWDEFADQAKAMQDACLQALDERIRVADQRAAEQAEAEELRARLAAAEEATRRAQAEAAAAATRAVEEARQREIAEKAAAEAEERRKTQEAEAERAKAEQAAAVERARAAAIQAEQERAAKAERDAKAAAEAEEQRRREAVEREAADAERREQQAREADERKQDVEMARGVAYAEAVEAMEDFIGLSAAQVIEGIRAGRIPHVVYQEPRA